MNIMRIIATLMNARTINIDITLRDSSLDRAFDVKVSELGINEAIIWYTKIQTSNLKLNYRLLITLIILRVISKNLILWTNRGMHKYNCTKQNLGITWNLFAEHHFYGGKKLDTNINGFTFDNEVKYVRNVHVVTFKYNT